DAAPRGGVQDEKLSCQFGYQPHPAERIRKVVENAVEERKIERFEIERRQVIDVTDGERDASQVASLREHELRLANPVLSNVKADTVASAIFRGHEAITAGITPAVEHRSTLKTGREQTLKATT